MSREEEILLLIYGCLSEFGDALKKHWMLLIGSRANGKVRLRSDFDLAVTGLEHLPSKTFFKWRMQSRIWQPFSGSIGWI